MKKKATVLLALISMCLIVTAGIGAVSASDEAAVSATVSKINPDGTTTVIKTFEGSGPMVVTSTVNIEDGSGNIIKEDREISRDELCGGLGLDNCQHIYITDPLEPLESVDASARTIYFSANAQNPARTCNIASTNPYGCAGCEAGRSGNWYYCNCWKNE